jgi:hypothetical protein
MIMSLSTSIKLSLKLDPGGPVEEDINERKRGSDSRRIGWKDVAPEVVYCNGGWWMTHQYELGYLCG